MHPIRNIILVTLLGIVSSNAYCAWEKIAGKGNEGLYVNLENLRFSPQSQTYRLWELSNVRDKQRTFSRVDLLELDCRNKRNRNLISLAYPKFFGQGDLLMGSLHEKGEWVNFESNPTDFEEVLCHKLK